MLAEGYVQNIAHLKNYTRALESGRLETARGVEFTPEDNLRREAIERILCDVEVDLKEPCARHGSDIAGFAGSLEALEPYMADGICEVTGGTVRVVDASRPIARLVAAAFDDYLKPEGKRHARAV